MPYNFPLKPIKTQTFRSKRVKIQPGLQTQTVFTNLSFSYRRMDAGLFIEGEQVDASTRPDGLRKLPLAYTVAVHLFERDSKSFRHM